MALINELSAFTVTQRDIFKLSSVRSTDFTKSILQMSDEISRNKNYEKSLEWLRTYVASLQAKLNSLVEELNTIYDLMLSDVMFKKADTKNTARLVNGTRNGADAPQFDFKTPHPSGDSGKGFAPYDAYLNNYYYNPYFGSRAMDFNNYIDARNPRELDVSRTYYENVGNTHHEFGASIFGGIGYLWMWDVDRINASYATTIEQYIDEDGLIRVPTYHPKVGTPGYAIDSTLDLKPNTPPYDEDFDAYSNGVAGINELGIDGWVFGGDAASQGGPFSLSSTYGWTLGDNAYLNSLGANAYGNGNNNIPGFAGKTLVQTTNSDRAFAFGGNDNWDNYTFEGTVGKVNGDDDWTRIWVRHKGSSDQHGYMVQIHWNDTTTISIYKVDNGNFVKKSEVDTGVNLGSGQNDAHWMRMKIVANDNKIDVYAGQIDRNPPESFNATPDNEIDKPDAPSGYSYAVSFTDDEANYEDFLEGKIGLSSSSQASWFDDLRIRGLPPDSNLLQVNVTAVQPNRGISSEIKVDDIIPLNSAGWPGFTAGEISYQNTSGHSFQPESLFLKVTGFDDNNNPTYTVVKADGTVPMMQVRGGMTSETVLTENFDSVANGSLPAGWTESVSHPGQAYWKVVSNESNSPSKSLHYGESDGDGFATGSAPNNGTVVSPTLDLSGADQVDISFWHSWETETQAPTSGYDLKYVDISSDGGASWTPLQDLYTGNPSQPWQQRSVVTLDGDAVNFTNNVKIRWRFNTGDGNFNDRRGWNIDDLVINKIVASVETSERYVVDDRGNIRDRFGIDGFSGTYGRLAGNTQQSNSNRRPDSPNANTGDDQNLYDYVPNLTLDDDEYDIVATIPSDFIYYREKLNGRFVSGSNSLYIDDWNESEKTDVIGNSNRPNLSFDPRGTNVLGRFDVDNGRVNIYNSDAVMFGNTLLTYVEQNPTIYNSQKPDTYAIWSGLSGSDQVGDTTLNSDNKDDYALLLNFNNKDQNGNGVLSAIKRVHVKVTGEPTIQNKITTEYDSLLMGGTTGYKPLGIDLTYGYINGVLQNGGEISNAVYDPSTFTFVDSYTENFADVDSSNPVPSGWSSTGIVEGESGYPNIISGSEGTISYTLTNTEAFNSGIPAGWTTTGTVQNLGGYPNIVAGPGGSASSSLRSTQYALNADTTKLKVTIDSACLTGGCGHAAHGALEYVRTMRVRFNDGTTQDIDLTTNNNVDVSTANGPTVPSTSRTFEFSIPAGKTSASYEFIHTTSDMSHNYTHDWTIDNLKIEQGKPAVQSALSSIRSNAIPLKFADTRQVKISIDSACLTGGCGHATHALPGNPEYLRTMRVRFDDGSFTDVDLTTENDVDVDTSGPTGPVVPTTNRTFLVDLPAGGSSTVDVEFIQTASDLTHAFLHNWTIDNLEIEEGMPIASPITDLNLYTDVFGVANMKLLMNSDSAIVNDGTVRVDVSYVEDLNHDGRLDNTGFTGVVEGRSYLIDPTTGQPLAGSAGQINTNFQYTNVAENSIVRIKTLGLDDLHSAGGWSGTSNILTNRTASMWVNGDRTGVDWSPHIGNHIQGTSTNPLVFKKSYYNNTGSDVTLQINTGVNAGARFFLNSNDFTTGSMMINGDDWDWVTQDKAYTVTLRPGRNDFEIHAFDDQQTDSYLQLYTPVPRAGIDIRADDTWQVSLLNGDAIYDETSVVNRSEMSGNNLLVNENSYAGFSKASEVFNNYLVVGKGRSGGSDRPETENRLTKRLKQIIDDPTFQDVLRFRLFNETYIAATVSDNRGDQIVGKLILEWDWRRKRVNVKQGSFSAVYKA